MLDALKYAVSWRRCSEIQKCLVQIASDISLQCGEAAVLHLPNSLTVSNPSSSLNRQALGNQRGAGRFLKLQMTTSQSKIDDHCMHVFLYEVCKYVV